MELSELKNISKESLEEAFNTQQEIPAIFSEGCRVLFLIQRHKDGGPTNNSKLRSYITRNKEEWIEAYAKLLDEKKYYSGISLRIYQTINTRNVDKGILHFKHNMIDADHFDEKQRQWFYIDIRNRMISSIMQQSCSESSYFLWDIDYKNGGFAVESFRNSLKLFSEIVYEYPTKNGFHIISTPFNPNLIELPSDIELKKDAMMCLKY